MHNVPPIHPLYERLNEITSEFLAIYSILPPELSTTINIMAGEYSLLMVSNELNVAFDTWTKPSMN